MYVITLRVSEATRAKQRASSASAPGQIACSPDNTASCVQRALGNMGFLKARPHLPQSALFTACVRAPRWRRSGSSPAASG